MVTQVHIPSYKFVNEEEWNRGIWVAKFFLGELPYLSVCDLKNTLKNISLKNPPFAGSRW
jgi:hypothetical protein